MCEFRQCEKINRNEYLWMDSQRILTNLKIIYSFFAKTFRKLSRLLHDWLHTKALTTICSVRDLPDVVSKSVTV